MDLTDLMNLRVQEHEAAIVSVHGLIDQLARVAQSLMDTTVSGGRIYICGNGGSASDAQHFAAELTGRFVSERQGFPAHALTTDTSALTAISNDYGFNRVFARQIEALGARGDHLVAISTSGNSQSVIEAVHTASGLGINTVGLLGRDGGQLASLVDQVLTVPVQATARIQEAHILILHLLCEAFEP